MADQPETVFTNAPEQTPVVETPTPEVKPEVVPAQTDAYADLLKSITREDGTQKYANVEDAITALKASQEFIETLKTENATYKSEVDKRTSAEEILEQMKATNTDEATPSESLDLSQIEALVEGKVNSTLTAAEQAKEAKANTTSVISAMTTKFGDKAEEQFISAALAAGLSVDQMNSLSATSPKAVLKLVGIEGQPQASPAPSTGSINTEALKPTEASISAKVPAGATGKDMVNAWRAAAQS